MRGCSGPRSSTSARRSRSSGSSRRSSRAPRCGARATPSPTRAPTSPTCRPGPTSTATSGSSRARRCGRRSRTGRSGASSSAAPTVTRCPSTAGISYLLVPMDQPGIEIRPIEQVTGTSEFNEVFFDGARTSVDNLVGEVNGGWKVAMGTLAFERGASTLGQQLTFENELREILAAARRRGITAEPVVRQRIVDIWVALRVMRYNALRSMPSLERGDMTPLTAVHKLYWASLHRAIGELAVDVLGPEGLVLRRGPVRAELRPADVPVHPVRHHLRRVQSGAAQHHRRAGPRPAARTEGLIACALRRRTPSPATRRCSRARSSSSPPRPAPASASPPRSAAPRRARPSC